MSFGKKYEKGDRQGMSAAKVFSAPPSSIAIVAGHNYRKVDPEVVAMFEAMYRDGKDVPPVLVALGEAGQLELVDGEHRVRAARQAGVEKIPMLEFKGTSDERIAAAWRFNQGSKATATENAAAFLRMREAGWSNARIAKETGASEGTVANHLLLAMTGPEVAAQVDAGAVAATVVISLARANGPENVAGLLAKQTKKVTTKTAAKLKPVNRAAELLERLLLVASAPQNKPEPFTEELHDAVTAFIKKYKA